MEIKYCCESAYQNMDKIAQLILLEYIQYCPYCGAKLTETKLYKEDDENGK